MTEPLIGARHYEPYLRLFPIWHYGPIYGRLDGRYIRDGWYPERYGKREVTAAEAWERARAYLDALDALENELAGERRKHDALPTVEHTAARRLLVDARRRNPGRI